MNELLHAAVVNLLDKLDEVSEATVGIPLPLKLMQPLSMITSKSANLILSSKFRVHRALNDIRIFGRTLIQRITQVG